MSLFIVKADFIRKSLFVSLVAGTFAIGFLQSCGGGLFDTGNQGSTHTPLPPSYDLTGIWTITSVPSEDTCNPGNIGQAQPGIMTLQQGGNQVNGDFLQLPLEGSISANLFQAQIDAKNLEGLSGCKYDLAIRVQSKVNNSGDTLSMIGDPPQEGFQSNLHVHKELPECAQYSDCYAKGDLYATKQHSNGLPIAEAGPNQSVTTGTTVILDGSLSHDPLGNPLTYSWSFVSKPTGSLAVLSNPTTSHPMFTADKDGNYEVQLIVNNGHQDSTPDTVTIKASTFFSFIGGRNKFTLNAQAITDTCYGGVFLPYVPTETFEVDVPGYAELPSTIILPLPFPLPTVEMHLVWDPVEEVLRLDPAYDPIPVSLDIGDIIPIFPCMVTANATGVLTPTSETEVNVLVEIMDLDIFPTGPFPCLLPDPRNPNCVISVSLQGENVGL